MQLLVHCPGLSDFQGDGVQHSDNRMISEEQLQAVEEFIHTPGLKV